MENRKSKVLISILLVALCLSVCIGLTYAYFTDTASSKGNKIQAGSLKLDLQLYDKTDGWHSIKDSQDPVFNYDKWEPGYVDAKLLRIVNLGDLAMQWEAKIVSIETISELANVIEVYVQTSNSEMPYPANRAEALAWTKVGTLDQFINTTEKLASGTFTAQGEAYYISIALYMPAEITDNTLQEKVVGEFDIQINATQLAYESDAFGPDYDTSATLPEGGVTPPDDTEETTSSTSTPEPDEPVEPTDPSIFTWERNDDGNSYTVTGLQNPGTVEEVNIPATYNGLPVTAIGDWAFTIDGGMDNDYTITSVTIPDSVITIGNSAFSGCSNLQNVTIPDSITYVGTSAFDNCNSLAYNEYDNAYYLGNDSNPCVILMKATDTSIESCNIHENTKVIYDYAFKDCYSLTGDLTIPNSVTAIGDYAFQNCSGLTGTLTIPNSVTTIGYSAFEGCSGLTGTLTIPNSVTAIGGYAFQNCSGLTGTLTIPNSVTTIGDAAFDSCSGLTSIKIPNSVTTIGNYTFMWCSNLTSIEIPNSVTTIGYSAFSGCSGLTEITIGNGVTTIGHQAFMLCSGLTSIEIPDSVTTIGGYAFDGCSGLTSIAIGNGVTTIGESAFSGCSGLKEATIPSSVVSIGINPFIGCTQLTNIAVADENTAYQSIDGNLYSKDGTMLVAYASGKSDTSFTIPDSVTTIGGGAFQSCSSLTSIEIPNSVTTIGEHAFQDCSSLTSIDIPDSVITIGDYAFAYCFYYGYDGYSGLTSVTIGNGVTTIGNSAFAYCSGLTSIEIPNSVTTIGDSAFAYCYDLTSIEIPNSVTTIGDSAFVCCSGLTNVTFNGTVAQWNAISFSSNWNFDIPATEVVCSDGNVTLN